MLVVVHGAVGRILKLEYTGHPQNVLRTATWEFPKIGDPIGDPFLP